MTPSLIEHDVITTVVETKGPVLMLAIKKLYGIEKMLEYNMGSDTVEVRGVLRMQTRHSTREILNLSRSGVKRAVRKLCKRGGF